jgi:Fic family protein
MIHIGNVAIPLRDFAVAQYGSIKRDTITVLTGFKRATRDAYIDRLRKRDFVAAPRGGQVTITEAGRAALPDNFEPLPTGERLRQYWLDRLPEGERRIMEVMLPFGSEQVDRESLSVATGYKRATRDAYLQRMRSKKIVEDADRGFVRLSANLFD